MRASKVAKAYGVVIQARMGSSRRPGKISYLFNNEEMLSYQINRLKFNGIINIVVATSLEKQDDITEKIANRCNVRCFRGSEKDVLNRFYECCRNYKIDVVVRVGGDDPLIDPEGIKTLIKEYEAQPGIDMIYTSHKEGWIYGTAAELFSFESLERANLLATKIIDREHIVPYYKNSSGLNLVKLNSPENSNRSDIFLSVDYQEDLELIEQIINFFDRRNERYSFSQKDLIKLYDSGKIVVSNRHLHEGFKE